MLKFEFPVNYTPGILLGIYNIDQVFINSLKSTLNIQYKNNINYLQITNDKLNESKLKKIKDSKYDEIGMISLKWMEKFEFSLPGLIIQMLDITDSITDFQNINLNQICEPIIKNINLIRNAYPQSYQIIIIKNFKRVSGLENNVKNFITNLFSIKFIYIFFINDKLYQENKNIIQQIGKLIIENIFSFYSFKINNYLNKYNAQKNNEQKEYAIKYLIKIYLLAKVTNIIHNDKNINYYDYINSAYNILIKLDKKSYMFCNDNLKVKYLEIKNLADFLLNEIMSDKNINPKNIFNLLINHLYNFDCKIFYNDKSEESNNINKIKDFHQYKDINFINYKWKLLWLLWLKYISEINKTNNINNADKNNILNYNILNNYYHIYILLKIESNFGKDICSRINKEKITKKIEAKYFEKVPKLYEMDGDNIKGLLSGDENLAIYLSDLILNDNNLLNPEYILKQIKVFFIKNKLNYYDFYIINKHCKDNKYNEQLNNILIQILNTNSNNLFKFQKVYSHISNKINKIILDLNLEKNENKYKEINFKIIEHLLLYASISSKELSNEQSIKLNNIFSNDNIIESNNKIIHLNNLENKLFNIKIIYNIKEVSLLDIVHMNIDISLLRKDLIINIEKIIIYFPKYQSNKAENKNSKEIIIKKELSLDNQIQINFNYLINCYLSKLYVTNIEIYLKNKIIINIYNKDKKYFIFCNNKININNIIDINFFNKYSKDNKILIGKDENHLLNIKCNLNNDKKDIFIKNIKINIRLLKSIENQKMKKWENTNNYEFIILEGTNGYLIIDNKELYYEFDNLNLEKDLPLIEFLLKIKELGNYKLNYKFQFVLINNNCPEEKCILECNKNILVHCIEPFNFKNEIQSSLYFINPQNKIKSYPINYPINIISYLENKISEKIVIQKVIHITNNNFIEISCPTEKLFSKVKNFVLKFSKNEIISINAKLISKNEISGSLGVLKIFWVSENLFKNNRFSELYMNQSMFDLSDININKLSLIIEGKYLKICKKYQIGIKNMEAISKLVQLNIKEENENKKYILCGKTNLSSILTQNREIKILFNIYNAITGMNIDEGIENKVHKFDNIIIVNEYYIFDDKDKFKSKSLKNIIYFTPELFKL